MVYVDTSVLVPLFLNEPGSAIAADWYAQEKGELVCASWCVPEFASALGIKQRTGAIDAGQASIAWSGFGRLVSSDLRMLTVAAAHFHRAAELILDTRSALRAGDALHLACAEGAGARKIATLDDVMARNAAHIKIKSALRRRVL